MYGLCTAREGIGGGTACYLIIRGETSCKLPPSLPPTFLLSLPPPLLFFDGVTSILTIFPFVRPQSLQGKIAATLL